MDTVEHHSGALTSGCQNCGNCKKGGCASIAEKPEIDGALDVFFSVTPPARDDSETTHILAAE